MKEKMRCARCGKTFKPSRSSQTLCDQCEKQERAARKTSGGAVATQARPTASGPTPIHIVSVNPPSDPPSDSGLYGSAVIREEQRREQQRRDDARRAEERARAEERLREQERRRAETQAAHSPRDHSPRDHDAHGPKRGPKPPRAERPAPAPRPPKPPRPVVPRFELTDELRTKIEALYLELAHPIEFDGIRTRIATELEIPKAHVKKVVAELRARMQLPSWWELQSYSGAETDLERIRMAYLPHLPVPAVGVHKTLAEELHLDPRTVYQGIRRIRAEMRLPQYNAPELHGDGPAPDNAPPPAGE